jgi:erythromycin esterase-like protein
MASDEVLVRAVLDAAQPLEGAASDLDALVQLAADKEVVLIGEASHGTHEFYRLRAQLTKRLIEEQGFGAVAAEADWPDSLRVNRFVRGGRADPDAVDALGGFERFPAWMWRNADVLDFVGWLRDHNDELDDPRRVGFYGLDLYSLHASMGAVLEYLDAHDAEAARRARLRYACFDDFGDDPQAYGSATAFGGQETCESEVVAVLI